MMLKAGGTTQKKIWSAASGNAHARAQAWQALNLEDPGCEQTLIRTDRIPNQQRQMRGKQVLVHLHEETSHYNKEETKMTITCCTHQLLGCLASKLPYSSRLRLAGV